MKLGRWRLSHMRLRWLTGAAAGAQTRESGAKTMTKTIDACATATTAAVELDCGCENGVPGAVTDKAKIHKRKRVKVPPVAPPELPDKPNFGPLVIVEESDSEPEVRLKKRCSGSGPECN